MRRKKKSKYNHAMNALYCSDVCRNGLLCACVDRTWLESINQAN